MLSFSTGGNLTHRTTERGDAWIRMDKNLRTGAEFLGDAFEGLFLEGVSFVDTPVERYREMEIDVVNLSRPPRAQMVKVNPSWSSIPENNREDFLERLRMRLVHQAADRDPQQSVARAKNIECDGYRHERIENFPPGQENESQASHDAETRDGVCEDVFPIGDKCERVRALPSSDEKSAKKKIDDGRSDGKENANAKFLKLWANNNLGDGLVNDRKGSEDDHGPFEAS